MHSVKSLAACCVLFSVAATLLGAPDPSRPFLRAADAPAPPVIDGVADDPVWTHAVWAGPFVNIDGNGLPEEHTYVAAAADDAVLYVAVTCNEALLEPALQRTHEVKATVTEADGPVFRDDCVELFLQPDSNTPTYYHLAANPHGVLYDARCEDGTFDTSWTSDTRCAAKADTSQWTVEFAIPLAALGGTPDNTAEWGFNAGRHRSAGDELSCWAPTERGFHRPEAFGTLAFGAPGVGVRHQRPPEFEAGPQSWRFVLSATQPVTGRALVRYGDLPWNTFADHWKQEDDTRNEQPARVNYQLTRRNRCIALTAPPERNDKTLCFRTEKLPVEGAQEYRFAARIKAEEITGGGRPLACSISSYDADGKPIKTYEPVCVIPEGTYDWTDVSGKWTAPENAAGILLWVVKWGGSGVSGTVCVDDIQLSPDGQPYNIIPNGAVETDDQGGLHGWLLASGSALADSYPRPTDARTMFCLGDNAGNLLYRSAQYRGNVTPRITEISASLVLKAGRKDSDNVYRLRELVVNQGGALALPVVLRSSHPERYEWADIVLDVPEFLHVVPPAPRADIVSRESAAGRRTYRIRMGRGAISPVESVRHNTMVTMLIAECGGAPETNGKGYEVVYHAEVKDAVEESTRIPLRVLPPLQWIRPETALIKHWACSSFYRPFRQLNDAERDAVAAMWRQAGFNRTGAALAQDLRRRYGFSARGHIPLITARGSLFPGGAEYLAEHPEARAIAFDGQKLATTFCPTYFLSDENGHIDDVREWLAQEARRFPHTDWDYEVPVTRDSSICACERCLEAFRNAVDLPDKQALTRETVRNIAKSQWIDWRCRENARIAHFFREVIKNANPDCLFSIYSGYQGGTDEKYGVDWRYMAVPADLVWAGYGRPVEAVTATHEAIAGRPFICGELAWFGIHPYNNERTATALFRRLSDGGSGIMAYFNWIVDGRFYEAVSRCASVVADFEPFFSWDVAADGTTRSHYRRDDNLVTVGGGDAADVTILLHGDERLVFAFNEKNEPRTLTLEHLKWRDGMTVIDVESKETLQQQHNLLLPAQQVRVLHVRPAVQIDVQAPKLLVGTETPVAVRDPILAWQGQGSHPGDQLFQVQIGTDTAFASPQTTTIKDVPHTAIMPQQLSPGTLYYWRVRGRDAVTGRTGPWSATGQVVRGMFAEPPTALPAFSPNDDGVLDEFELSADLVEACPWTVNISAEDGTTVQTFTGRGNRLSIRWDGTDANGKPVPSGTYRYMAAPDDHAELGIDGTVELNPRVGLQNPGFEQCRGFVLTVPDGSADLDKDYRTTLSDTYALRLTTGTAQTRAYWSNYGGGSIGSNAIAVEPGKTYRFAAAVKTDLKAGTAGIAMAFFTTEGRWAQVPGKPAHGVNAEDVTGTSDWTERQIELTAPEDAFSAVLFFKITDAEGTCWFDKASFQQVGQ